MEVYHRDIVSDLEIDIASPSFASLFCVKAKIIKFFSKNYISPPTKVKMKRVTLSPFANELLYPIG